MRRTNLVLSFLLGAVGLGSIGLAQGQQNSNPDVDIKEASPLHEVVREGCSSAQRDSKRFKISVCHDGAFMDKAYVFSQEGTRMAEGFCTPQQSNGQSYRSRSVIIPKNSSSLRSLRCQMRHSLVN